MADERKGMLQGTLELLILQIVSLEPVHGWGITQRIEQMSRRVFQVNQGSLYPALERLTRKGWLRSEWHTTESNRRARYYAVTAAGSAQLAAERTSWERTSSAVNGILAWSGALP
ncbi:MAG: PadR family transcriptional regulator [Gemmatimonadaceae bacterium]